MADNMHFTSREKLEVFIRQNPKRFLEELERSPDLRNNFQQLLQDWNNGDLIQIAQLLQGMEVRNPINNKLMIVEEKAKSFYYWSFNELREVQQNPYHKLTSFQHYLHETMKKREELDDEEEKERLRKAKEQKIQTQFDKEKLEQEKVNMHIVMKAIEVQFKQNLQRLVANMDVKALQQLEVDLQPAFDSLKNNEAYNTFNSAWEKASANTLKSIPNADKLGVIVKSIGIQLFAKTQDEETHKRQIALFESLGMTNAREVFERIRNGTATEKDMELVQKTAAAHIDDHRVKHEYGNITGVVQGDRKSAEDLHNMVMNSTHNIANITADLKHNRNTQPNAAKTDIANLVNNIRNTTSDVKNSQFETDVSSNLNVESEKLRIRN